MTISVSGLDVNAVNGGVRSQWELAMNTPTGRTDNWYFKDPSTLFGGPRIIVLNQWGRSPEERLMQFEFTRAPGSGYPGPYTSRFSKAISGIVEQGTGNPVKRKVRLYRRSDGAMVGLEVLSDPVTGDYSFAALLDGEEYQRVALDDDVDPAFNAIIDDRITPA